MSVVVTAVRYEERVIVTKYDRRYQAVYLHWGVWSDRDRYTVLFACPWPALETRSWPRWSGVEDGEIRRWLPVGWVVVYS